MFRALRRGAGARKASGDDVARVYLALGQVRRRASDKHPINTTDNINGPSHVCLRLKPGAEAPSAAHEAHHRHPAKKSPNSLASQGNPRTSCKLFTSGGKLKETIFAIPSLCLRNPAASVASPPKSLSCKSQLLHHRQQQPDHRPGARVASAKGLADGPVDRLPDAVRHLVAHLDAMHLNAKCAATAREAFCMLP